VQVGDVVLMLLADELGASPTDLSPAAARVRAARRAPDRLLVLKGPQAGREIPLDRGIVTLGGDPLCTVRLEGPEFAGPQLLVRPLAKGRYEVLRQGSLRLYVGIHPTERQILWDSDLLLLEHVGAEGEGDRVALELRFLSEGKAPPTYPGTPLPVYELPWLSNEFGQGQGHDEPSGRGLDVGSGLEGEAGAGVGDETPTPDATEPQALGPLLVPESGSLPALSRNDTIVDPPSSRWMRDDADVPSSAGPAPRPNWRVRNLAIAAMVLGPAVLLTVVGLRRVWPPPEAPTRFGAPVLVTSATPAAAPSAFVPGAPSSMQAPAAPSAVAPAASPPPRASAPKASPSAGPRTPKKPAWQAAPVVGAEPPDPLEAAARAETARRSRLETRVWGGKASVTEIRQLRDLCAREGDRACYDRAKLLLDADARLP
jgi:hypothetical protein